MCFHGELFSSHFYRIHHCERTHTNHMNVFINIPYSVVANWPIEFDRWNSGDIKWDETGQSIIWWVSCDNISTDTRRNNSVVLTWSWRYHYLMCPLGCSMHWRLYTWMGRADSRLAPSQWETSLQSKDVSHWLGGSRESALMGLVDIWRFVRLKTSSFAFWSVITTGAIHG